MINLDISIPNFPLLPFRGRGEARCLYLCLLSKYLGLRFRKQENWSGQRSDLGPVAHPFYIYIIISGIYLYIFILFRDLSYHIRFSYHYHEVYIHIYNRPYTMSLPLMINQPINQSQTTYPSVCFEWFSL